MSRKSCQEEVAKIAPFYREGDACYALYYGPRRDRDPRWVPAIVRKRLGTRCVTVKVVPQGPIWRSHIEQLRPRHTSEEDSEPGEDLSESKHSSQSADPLPKPKKNNRRVRFAEAENGPDNPRRSSRVPQPRRYWPCDFAAWS